uniref:Uncharacterized protein n=1 Tax=Arundo donax TaxID=35708 RepID=A0A0A8YSW4_ARUDO
MPYCDSKPLLIQLHCLLPLNLSWAPGYALLAAPPEDYCHVTNSQLELLFIRLVLGG